MAGERSLAVGVSYVGYGTPGDGVAASTFTQLTIVKESSVVFNFNDPTSVDFRAEGLKDPWESFDKAGDADSIDIVIPSPTAAEMAAFMGGTATGDKWEAPNDIPTIRKSLKLVSSPYKDKQTEYIFAYCKVMAKPTQAPGAETTDELTVRFTKMAAITAAGVQNSPWSKEVKAVV